MHSIKMNPARFLLWNFPKARSFRGELLGLVAIHTLALAVAQFFPLDCMSGKICCGNIVALNQCSKVE